MEPLQGKGLQQKLLCQDKGPKPLSTPIVMPWPWGQHHKTLGMSVTGGGHCASNDCETQENRALESMRHFLWTSPFGLATWKGHLLTKGNRKIKSAEMWVLGWELPLPVPLIFRNLRPTTDFWKIYCLQGRIVLLKKAIFSNFQYLLGSCGSLLISGLKLFQSLV